jgi:hypothetical protein
MDAATRRQPRTPILLALDSRQEHPCLATAKVANSLRTGRLTSVGRSPIIQPTLRGNQGRFEMPPQAARAAGPPRSRTRRWINRAKRSTRRGCSTPPRGIGWSGRCGWPGRSAGDPRGLGGRWCGGSRWARRIIAQARAVGRRVRLSLFSSTTTSAPQGGVLLVAAHPGRQPLTGAFPGGEQATVERYKRPVQQECGRRGGWAGGRSRPWRCQAVRNARSDTASSSRAWLMPTWAARCQACSAASRFL